jgi:hypothetical protein
MAGPDAVPAGGVRNPIPGRPGTPPGGHYDPPARSFALPTPLLGVGEARTRGLRAGYGLPRSRDGAPRGVCVSNETHTPRQACGPEPPGPMVRRSALHSPSAMAEGRRREDDAPASLTIGAMARAYLPLSYPHPPSRAQAPAGIQQSNESEDNNERCLYWAPLSRGRQPGVAMRSTGNDDREVGASRSSG